MTDMLMGHRVEERYTGRQGTVGFGAAVSSEGVSVAVDWDDGKRDFSLTSKLKTPGDQFGYTPDMAEVQEAYVVSRVKLGAPADVAVQEFERFRDEFGNEMYEDGYSEGYAYGEMSNRD